MDTCRNWGSFTAFGSLVKNRQEPVEPHPQNARPALASSAHYWIAHTHRPRQQKQLRQQLKKGCTRCHPLWAGRGVVCERSTSQANPPLICAAILNWTHPSHRQRQMTETLTHTHTEAHFRFRVWRALECDLFGVLCVLCAWLKTASGISFRLTVNPWPSGHERTRCGFVVVCGEGVTTPKAVVVLLRDRLFKLLFYCSILLVAVTNEKIIEYIELQWAHKTMQQKMLYTYVT